MKKMINKIINFIIKDIKYNYKQYLIFILVIPWFFIEFNYYVYTPGGLIPLTSRIEIENSYESKGSFNLTYVASKKGIAPIILLSYIIPSWDLVNMDNSRIEDETSKEIEIRNTLSLKETSYDAIIAAFKEANKEYIIKSIDLTVSHVYKEADTNLLLGDIIKSIDGHKVEKFDDIKNVLNNYKEGDKVTLNVLRDNKIIECYSKLIKLEDRIIIGISILEMKDVETDPEIKYIFKSRESGSSRGLMCALEIYNRLTKYDLTKGDIISGTGTIDENGEVGAIDGVKYKLAGAVKKKAKVFIVPSDNYEEAMNLKEENNYKIEIIEADTLHNVIEKLKKRNKN